MPSELKEFQAFFNNRVFRIPDYQRGYAWEREQLEDFWNDLTRLPEGRNHYTGQITLEVVPKAAWKSWDEDTWLIEGRNYKPFYVVDGQQRLTTSVILLKCLIDSIGENGSLGFRTKSQLIETFLYCQNGVSLAYIFGYEKDNPSYDFFKTQILGQNDNGNQGVRTLYTSNLLKAKEYFLRKLEGKDAAQLEDCYKRLTQRFVYNEYELDQDLDVFVAFETMNNRGKKLSKLELLKNRLIYLSTLVNVDGDQRVALRRNITNAWKTIYEYLGKESSHPLDDDEFLRAHWIISFNYAREEADQFAVFLLDKHFTLENTSAGILTPEIIQAYVNSIQNAVKAWHAIHFPHKADVSDNVAEAIDRLSRIGRAALAPLMMAALLRNVDDETCELYEKAERFIFVVRRLCNRRSNTGDTELYRMAGQVNRGDIAVKNAAESVEAMTERFYSLDKAVSEIRELFENDGAGFYFWTGRQFFLFEYEQHLRGIAGMHGQKLTWEEFTDVKRDHVSVEHIYPQTPKNGDWPEFEVLNDEEKHIARNSLGNLLALSQSRNSRFSNRAFSEKKQDQDGIRGYFNGSYSEIEVAQVDEWSPQLVLNRGITMLEFMEKKWRVSLGRYSQKVLLLRLEFLIPEAERPKTPAALLAEL